MSVGKQRRLVSVPVAGVLAKGMAGAGLLSTPSSYGSDVAGTPILAGRLLATDGSPAANVAVTVARRDFSGTHSGHRRGDLDHGWNRDD
jgi:hypothetical protein